MSECMGDTSGCPWSEREAELLAITHWNCCGSTGTTA